MTEETRRAEYMTAEQYEAVQRDTNALTPIADAPKSVLRFSRSSNVTRQDVVNAFTDAFQMIGGVDRLALWADSDPASFFKIFGKLLPPSASDLLDGKKEFVVRHILPPPNLEHEVISHERQRLSDTTAHTHEEESE